MKIGYFFPGRGGAVTKIGHFHAFKTPFRGRTLPRSSKNFRKLAWREGGASAPHIQRYLPIVMVQNQRCCTKKYPAGGENFSRFSLANAIFTK